MTKTLKKSLEKVRRKKKPVETSPENPGSQGNISDSENRLIAQFDSPQDYVKELLQMPEVYLQVRLTGKTLVDLRNDPKNKNLIEFYEFVYPINGRFPGSWDDLMLVLREKGINPDLLMNRYRELYRKFVNRTLTEEEFNLWRGANYESPSWLTSEKKFSKLVETLFKEFYSK